MADNENKPAADPAADQIKEKSGEDKSKSLGPSNREPYSDRGNKSPMRRSMPQPQSSRGQQPVMMMWNDSEPDCCLCFHLDCGVKTLFFLVASGITLIVINVIGMMVHEQWYVLIQLLVLLPMIYILYYVYKYGMKDSYQHRYRISEGFKYQFIISTIINLILFIVVLTSLEEFFDDDEHQHHINQNYPGAYAYYRDGHYGYPGSHIADHYGAPADYYYGNDASYKAWSHNQHRLHTEIVSDETIAWFAVLYGSLILIYGLLGFYWWTVVRRWADSYLNNVKTLEDYSSGKSPATGHHSMRESHRKSNRM